MAMKLAIDTHVLRNTFGDKRTFEILSEAGFDSADYSYFGWAPDDPILSDGYLSYARKTKERC